jgi:hypothetical protein
MGIIVSDDIICVSVLKPRLGLCWDWPRNDLDLYLWMWDNKFKYGYWIYSSSYTTATTTTTYTAISCLPNFGPQPPFYFHIFLCLIPIVSVVLAITLLWLSCVSMPFSFPTDTYICTYTHTHIFIHRSIIHTSRTECLIHREKS